VSAVRLRRLVPAALVLLLGALVVLAGRASADSTPQTLPFAQSWSNKGLITTDDVWSGVPGVVAYRGDDLTAATGTDPRTIVAPSDVVDVNANRSDPNRARQASSRAPPGISSPP
jgi:uncharacterized protein